MSQRLPPRPNLDYLKKQAKDVLRVFRHRNAGWRLADAQHALARGYGFPTWSDLKRHVESLQLPSGPMCATRGQAGDLAGESSEAAEQQHAPGLSPIVGTWAARPPTGACDPDHSLAADAVVAFGVTDGILTLTQVAAGAAGREIAMKMVIRTDGHDHPIPFGGGLLLQARWTNLRTLEALVKQGDRIVGGGTWEVSTDGELLVLSTAGQRVVFGRVSSR